MKNNNNEILFSIVIPAYNEESFLPQCLDSVKNQAGDFNYEIIVVDNDSSDRTFVIAQNSGVRVVQEKKKGVGQARKLGTELAQGKYILNIDADTRLPENYLKEVYKRFQKDSRLVCIGGQFFYYDAPWWKDVLRFVFHRLLVWFCLITAWGRIGPMGNNMCFKRKVYEKISGFDSDLKFGEDADLCNKLSRLGKVKLDMSLKCFISARRYKLNKRFFIYTLNFISLCFRRKPLRNVLPPVDRG